MPPEAAACEHCQRAARRPGRSGCDLHADDGEEAGRSLSDDGRSLRILLPTLACRPRTGAGRQRAGLWYGRLVRIPREAVFPCQPQRRTCHRPAVDAGRLVVQKPRLVRFDGDSCPGPSPSAHGGGPPTWVRRLLIHRRARIPIMSSPRPRRSPAAERTSGPFPIPTCGRSCCPRRRRWTQPTQGNAAPSAPRGIAHFPGRRSAQRRFGCRQSANRQQSASGQPSANGRLCK